MKRLFSLAVIMTMAVISAWAGYFSPTFVSTNVDASASVSNETVDKMFDGIYNTASSKWCAATTRGTWKGRYVIMDAGMPIILRGYRLIAGGDTNTNQGRRWKAWRIYGSNSSDAEGEWKEVDTKTNSLTSSANYGISEYTTTATVAYQYYKLYVDDCASGDIIQMSEMQLAAVLDGDYASPAFVSTNITEGKEGYSADKMFDGVYNTEPSRFFAKSSVAEWKGGYVIMDARTPILLQGYRLIGGCNTSERPGRRWKAWRLYGSNSSAADGASWTLVDQKTDSPTSATDFGVNEYTVPVSEAYRYYKLFIDDNVSGEEIHMSEMQLAGVAAGTGVTFTSNEAKGYQSETENVSRSLSGLTFDATKSDWVMDGTVVNNGAVGTAGLKQCIQRRNKGWWSGDLCDWLTLTYEAPSYTKIDYTLTVDVSVAKTGEKNSVRASYYDFGTDANGNWASRTKLSDGTTTYRTTNGIYTDRKAPVNGELAAVWMYTSTYGKTDYDENSVTLNVTVDNSEGTEAKSENRYGMFVSSKSVTANKENILNYSQLRLKYTATATYYNVITFDANEGEGTMASQTIAGAGTLTANTLTRDGYTFTGWNTQADGKGTAYTNEQAITVTSTTKGAITLYAQWEVAAAAADYTWVFTNTTLENNQLADGGVVLSNVTDTYEDIESNNTWINGNQPDPLTITADGKKIVRIVVTTHAYETNDPAEWIVNQTEGFTWTKKEQYVAEWTGEATSVAVGGYDAYLFDKIEVWVAEGEETPTAIDTPAAQKAQKVIKTIENGRVVIIRDGEKFDITGRKL